MNIKDLIKAFDALPNTPEEQRDHGSFELINVPTIEELSKLDVPKMHSALDKVDAVIIVETKGGSVEFTLSEFQSLYTGMVKVWPIAKPAKGAIARSRMDLIKASSEGRKSVTDIEKVKAKEAKDKERAEKAATLAKERETKAKERAAEAERKAKEAADKAKAKADEAARKAKEQADAARAKADELVKKATPPAPTPAAKPAKGKK